MPKIQILKDRKKLYKRHTYRAVTGCWTVGQTDGRADVRNETNIPQQLRCIIIKICDYSKCEEWTICDAYFEV